MLHHLDTSELAAVVGGGEETCAQMQNLKRHYEHVVYESKTFLRWEYGRRLPGLYQKMIDKGCLPPMP